MCLTLQFQRYSYDNEKNQAQRHNMCILNHDKNSLVLGKESIYLPIPKSFY